MKVGRLPTMLLLGLLSGAIAGVFATQHSVLHAVVFPAIILVVYTSIPFLRYCRWSPFRFACLPITAILAHFAFCGLMVHIADASNPTKIGATMGALFGTIGSFLFVFGFCCAFNPEAKLETMVVGTILGGLAASASGALLMTNQVPWGDNTRLVLAYVLWHGALGCSLNTALRRTIECSRTILENTKEPTDNER